MVKKTSIFDDFLVATILADIFDPSGSDDMDYVSKKIVDGLDSFDLLKSYAFDNKDDMAA